MTEQMSSPVSELLDQLGIEYQWIEIPLDPDRKPIRSLEELVEARGQTPEQIVRSLLFRTASGNFVLLAVPGNGRVDWGGLRKHLSERRLTMADPDEVLEATGYPIGAVPPLALPDSVRCLVDEKVFALDEIIIGSGVLGYALALSSEDLRKALKDTGTGRFVKE